MAVDVEWQDENGRALSAYSGPPLTWKVLKRAPAGWTCVSFIDPVGDTTFNQRQIDVLVGELEEWANSDNDPALRHLLNFVSHGRGRVHTYLKFIGD